MKKLKIFGDGKAAIDEAQEQTGMPQYERPLADRLLGRAPKVDVPPPRNSRRFGAVEIDPNKGRDFERLDAALAKRERRQQRNLRHGLR